MIVLDAVTFMVGRLGARRLVLDAIDATFEKGGNYVLFGLRGSGKTSLLRLLCGLEAPNAGHVRRYGSIAPPIGTGQVLTQRNTVRALATFYADLFQADRREILDFVTSFSQMPDFVDIPFEQMTVEQRARLNHSFAYAIPADYYLFDGMLGVGESGFRARCERAFAARRAAAGTIVATSVMRRATEWGDKGALLFDGKLYLFDSVESAREVFEEIDVQNVKSLEATIKQLVSLGRFAEAEVVLLDHIAGNGDDVAACAMLADVSLKSGNLNQAAAAAGMILDRDPDAVEPYMILAGVAQREGRLLDAIANAEEVLQRAPDNRDAGVMVARSYELLELHSQAGAAWRRLAAPTAADVPLRFAIRNYIKADDWEGVLAICDDVAKTDTSDSYLHALRAQALMEVGHWDAFREVVAALARVDLDGAIRLAYRVLKAEKWQELTRLLLAFPHGVLRMRRDDRLVALMLSQLKRESALRRRAGKIEEADEIDRSLGALAAEARESVE